MDIERPFRLLPHLGDLAEEDLVTVTGAIDLVVRGEATRVTLGGLRDAELLGAEVLPLARAAGVQLALVRDLDTDAVSLVVGPSRT